jgi:LmbE family N-acetylglucosaminyl deacetylase
MRDASFRQIYMHMLLRQLYRPKPISMRPTIVFAPHQDDETLGCGGVIAQKRRAGVPVWIVFLTDGSRSHQRFIHKEDVKALRVQEARNAGKVLGVPDENILFLQFPNGGLRLMQLEAQKKVAALLTELCPQEIYIPSPLDFHAEHRVTALVVQAALEQWKAKQPQPLPLQVFEYPIWFWYQWPWVSLQAGDAEERSVLLKRGLRYGFGTAFLRLFQYAAPIQDVLETKRQALAEYTSQTQRLNQEVDWPTLQDVAGGAFIECFFRDYELFHQKA